MGVLRAMLTFISRRRQGRAAEQADVDRALSAQRVMLRQEMHAFEAETKNLRSAEARMMEALGGAVMEASRARQRMRQ